MTEKEYYSEKRVSSSSLKWFETSPLFFKKMLDKEIEQETKRYFEIGKKIHMKILEPNEFSKNYIYLDYDTPKSENQRKFCEDYIAYSSRKADDKLIYAYKNNYTTEKLTEDKILEKATELKKQLSRYITYLKKRSEVKDVLTYTDNKLIEDLAECTKTHIAASKLLYLTDEDRMMNIEEYNENIIFFEWFGIPCKSMLDRLVIDHTNKIIKLVDIKTTSNLGDFSHSFEEFSYYRQMVFYWAALHQFCKDKDINIDKYTKKTYIVGLQKGDLPECRVLEISENWLSKGLNEIEEVLPKIKWHYDNNLWEHRREYYENNGIETL
jgi:hypothetical protein